MIEMIAHFILYIRNQELSTLFYASVLNAQPSLDVPGMTEFQLSDTSILGLMPEAGIKRLLSERLPDPAAGYGIPRAELYLRVPDAPQYHARALAAGALELSPPLQRDWGDTVSYCLDPDGHVVAFADA
ncbi:MAG: VOC family protein [Candidatus Obscuribacterales bacterium]